MASDQRKLRAIQADLKQLQTELLPHEASTTSSTSSSSQSDRPCDDFERVKRILQALLHDVRSMTERLADMDKASMCNSGTGRRDVSIIALTMQADDRLREGRDLLKQLCDLQNREHHKKPSSKKRLSQSALIDREEHIRLLTSEISALHDQVRPSSKVRLTHQEQAMIERREQRQERKRDPQRSRDSDGQHLSHVRNRSRSRSRSRSRQRTNRNRNRMPSQVDVELGSMIDCTVDTSRANEVAFQEQVDRNKAHQETILVSISNGLDDLHAIAQNTNHLLSVQGEMLQTLDTGLDKTIDRFRSNNQRLRDILKESGGMKRWCPVMCCLIILLSLCVLAFKI